MRAKIQTATTPKATTLTQRRCTRAARSGRLESVQLLVERGARPDIRDTIWNATPLDWAEHASHTAIADYLRQVSEPQI